MPLQDIVNVQITAQTQSIPEANFGVPLILGTHKSWNDFVRSYSSIQDVGLDFTPNQPEYIASQAVFAQNPTVTNLLIGRRDAPLATLNITSAILGETYIVTINNTPVSVNSSNFRQISTITWSADFVANNLINVVFNNVPLSAAANIIDFDIDFVSLNSIVATVNTVPLAPVIFSVDQATTIGLLATAIAGAAGVASALVTDTKQITVTFTNPAASTVNSVITTLGATQPVATIQTAAITNIIDFDIDFVALNSITTTVNGTALTPAVIFTVDQATTIGLVAAQIETAPGVASAVVTGTNQITVVFTNPGTNAVTSVITTLGATQPVATIVAGGFTFITNQATTIGLIATAMAQVVGTVFTAIATGDQIVVTSVAGTANTINSSVVTKGASQATALIVNDTLNKTIAIGLAAAITAAFSPAITATNVLSPDGTLTISAAVPTTPYTLSVSTSIIATNAAIITITDAQPGATYNLILQGVEFQYIADNTVQTIEQIAAALVSEINSYLPVIGINATDNLDGTFLVASSPVTNIFFVQVTPEIMATTIGINILPYVPAGLVATRLNDIVNENNNWYGLACTDRTTSTVKAIADWAESMNALQPVIFGTASSDLNIINQAVGIDTTSVAAYINIRGYVRSFVLYSQDADSEYPECAWFGKVLPLSPGSETWKFKTLAGVAYSNLTTTQSFKALSKKANTYEFIGGVGITQNGTSGQGQFLILLRGIDWLRSTITTNVFGLLVRLPKVPYTDAGIAAVQAQVQLSLQLGIDNNFIADNPPPVVTVPLAANVPPNDKANRILNNVKFTATLAGAIHAVNIQGIVTV